MSSSASASRVAVIFGTGPNVGASLVKAFLGAGYRVATVSRSGPPSSPTSSPFSIQADLSDPSSGPSVFAKIAQAGWPFPSVVIWNAASLTPPAASDPQNPFAIPEEGFDRDVNLMVKSPFIAAGQAVDAWRAAAGEGARKGTFIMTGNITPRRLFPPLLTTSGIGKSAANYWMGTADGAFKEQGIRFFFADERKSDGEPVVNAVSGESHAEMYLTLVEGKEDLPYYVTFVKGKYHKFD